MAKLKQLLQYLKRLHKERTVDQQNNDNVMYTEEQLMARLKFFIGICLAMTLTGIVFVVLYSLIFVTQPLNAISPIDQKFFELIIPIATFLTGTLSGIMLAGNDKDAQKLALQAANKGWERPPTPIAPTTIAPTPTSPAVRRRNWSMRLSAAARATRGRCMTRPATSPASRATSSLVRRNSAPSPSISRAPTRLAGCRDPVP